ncbi:MAG: hypothetical protein JWQ98_107 [Chlorobi bacterium]|nr:hypothetical protein [Chlorobiota bacterium]
MKTLYRSALRLLLPALVAACAGLPAAMAQGGDIPLTDITPGRVVEGFRAEALYLDDAGAPMGARFIHQRTGFVFDLLRIQSVPQSFIWVNSFPTSDMGEPHTQEHLLLGKGSKGRYLGSLENMTLSQSNAFTQQWRTCYNFNTSAGGDAYYRELRGQLDALLNPDYTDEEISREVCNFGVADNPGDSILRLEEKGTVYNEMLSTFEKGWPRMQTALDRNLYGPSHPLALVSGGLPSEIRVMKPSDIRRFHDDNYHLANMGMVGAFPKEMALPDILRSTAGILDDLEKPGAAGAASIHSEANLPTPVPAPEGTISIVDYPNHNVGEPGPMLFAWAPRLRLDVRDETLLQLFVQNIADDATTNLYKRLIDPATRKVNVGASSVFGWVSGDQGHPVYIGFGDADPASMTEGKIAEVRKEIVDELARIAAMRDGSPELKEFNTRILNRVVATRRSLSQFVNSPPRFGFRNSGSEWMEHLRRLERSSGFKRFVTLKPELDEIQQMVSSDKNIWRENLAKWKLVGSVPYAAAARPSSELVEREEADHQNRIIAEVKRLREKYHITSGQDAIRRFRHDYDSASTAIDVAYSKVPTPRFVETPPLTLDDQLDYHVGTLPGSIPLVTSTFDNMTSATAGVAFRLDGVPEDEIPYLSLLPDLLTQSGVIENGTPIPYEKAGEQRRRDILSLDCYYRSDYRTGRCELVMRGAGNNLKESERAIDWMKMTLFNADWRPENLAHIRDLVDHTLSGLRTTMQGSEESWVNDPADAYAMQGHPVFLAANSFMTREHNAFRLRWLLADPGKVQGREPLLDFMKTLASAATDRTRPELHGFLGALQGDSTIAVAMALRPLLDACRRLSPSARAVVTDMARDLDVNLSEIPDETLAGDWAYLALQIRRDFQVPPAKVLATLDRLRRGILTTGNARAFLIGSGTSNKALQERLAGLVAGLEKSPAVAVTDPATAPADAGSGLVASRLRSRMPSSDTPVYVGLVNSSTGSGVFLNSAPGPGYRTTNRDSLVDFLAAMLYSGHGAHGIFMKTWGAGLAYSNGLRVSARSGKIRYYAERCPTLPQTLRFVVDELKNAPHDSTLVDYAIAQAFTEYRAANTYESRGEAIAADLADGLTPDVVTRFRKGILELRNTPGLSEQLYSRLDSVCGTVLPGLGPKPSDVKGGNYFVIGPEKQMAQYEDYIHTVDGKNTKLYRLYPRDFWMVGEANSQVGTQ